MICLHVHANHSMLEIWKFQLKTWANDFFFNEILCTTTYAFNFIFPVLLYEKNGRQHCMSCVDIFSRWIWVFLLFHRMCCDCVIELVNTKFTIYNFLFHWMCRQVTRDKVVMIELNCFVLFTLKRFPRFQCTFFFACSRRTLALE